MTRVYRAWWAPTFCNSRTPTRVADKQLEEFSLDEEDVLEYFKETLVAKRKARMVSGLNYRHPTLFHVGSNNSSFLRKSVLHV
eukprot:COSAG03_NODE_10347_length_656_cov_0.883303_1_plen_83_part_00